MSDRDLTVDDEVVVGLEYTLRLEDDEVVDSTSGEDPLEFIQGRGQLISGLEEELYGMSVGDEKEVVVEPEAGYGEFQSDAFQEVSRDVFPEDMELSEGMGLQMRNQEGEVFETYVAELRPERVLLDFNHPLAGETLYFDVKVASLRPATSEELSHGHVHGEGDGH